jgi:hypothetical protein
MHTFHFSTLNELPNLGSHSIAADVNSLASVVIDVDFLAWFSGGFTLGDFAFACRCLGSPPLAIQNPQCNMGNLRSRLVRVRGLKSLGKLDPIQPLG